MKTSERGLMAEAAAANYLLGRGFEVLDRNWKTSICEIDIIAKKSRVIYFVEVKFRASSDFGSGYEHITARKIKKLNFAARVWCQHHRYSGDYQILAAEVSGDEYQSINITEIYA